MNTEGTSLLLLTISAFWSSSRWPSWPPRWAPEDREVSHEVVVTDRFHCSCFITCLLICRVFLFSKGGYANIKKTSKFLINDRSPVDSPQKGLVMRTSFSCHDVIMRQVRTARKHHSYGTCWDVQQNIAKMVRLSFQWKWLWIRNGELLVLL